MRNRDIQRQSESEPTNDSSYSCLTHKKHTRTFLHSNRSLVALPAWSENADSPLLTNKKSITVGKWFGRTRELWPCSHIPDDLGAQHCQNTCLVHVEWASGLNSMCYQQKIVRRTHRTVLNGLHTYLPAYARMHVHTYIHDHTCMHTCTHAHTQSHASMHPCIHASMHPCIHAHIHHCPPLLPRPCAVVLVFLF